MVTFSFLSTALANQSHYEAYQQALKGGAAIPLKYLKVLFFGPPRAGKSSMRRRLVGEIQNLANEPVQASTGTAEVHEVIVKKVTISTAVVKETRTETTTEYKWSSVKVLCGEEKCNHETDLDEELEILYQFICGTIEKKLPVPDEEGPQEHTTKRQSLARVEKESSTQGDLLQETNLTQKTDNQVASGAQDVSSVGQQGDKLSPEQINEIEKAIEAFNKIIRRAGQEKLEDLLEDWIDKTILMNMVDTGGQPAFLEMLPALTIGPALYLIFFRLDQKLKRSYKLQLGRENRNFDLDDFYTNEQVIFQALSSIACFSCTTPAKAGMPNPSHAAALIGTYKDKLGSDPKAKISKKDKELKETLKEVLKLDLRSKECFLKPYSKDQLMFAVDNKHGGEEELAKVHERLEIIIKHMYEQKTTADMYKHDNKWKIPASWLMFSIFIRKMNKRTLSLSQCCEIGRRLKVGDTNEALWFLHHYVGILMHFSDIPEIKDIVICDPQVVFDSVTDLIMDGFTFDKVGMRAENFKTSGQFSYADIENIVVDPERDSLSPQQLVGLLEHLNIIAPIRFNLPPSDMHQAMKLPLNLGPSPQSGTNQEKVYFMPAVLRHATEEQLQKQSPKDKIFPLMIHFKCGFIPVGVFCAIIANLVALGWTPHQEPDQTLFKNKVTLLMEYEYDVTLISRPKQIEVHITTSESGENTCSRVRETICKALDQVISMMKYKDRISSSSDPKLYELGFQCPEHLADDHLVTIKTIKIRSREDESKFVCQKTGRKAVCRCFGQCVGRCVCGCQSFDQLCRVWFCEVSQS